MHAAVLNSYGPAAARARRTVRSGGATAFWRLEITPVSGASDGLKRPNVKESDATGAGSPEADRASEAKRLASQIVAIAERADRDAFESLFLHFAPRVKSYLLRLGTPPDAAEELTQETLLTVWRRAEAFNPALAGASTWIFTIARNLRIDVARRAARQIPPDDPLETFCQAPGPAEALDALEDEIRIQQALTSLPDDQARVIRLAFFADKPHAEIALDLNLPLGTVKSRLRLAMARLRGVLDDRP